MNLPKQNVPNVPVVKASIATASNKRFYQLFYFQDFATGLTKVFAKTLLIFCCLAFATQMSSAQTILTGGKQKATVIATGAANNEVSCQLVNGTGHDIWDLRIMSTAGQIKSYDIQGKNGGLANGKVNPKAASIHVKFSKAVKTTPPNNTMKVTLTTTAPNDSIYVIPTDTLGADLMLDKSSNANTGNNQQSPKPVSLNGGKKVVTFDPSNFPSIDYVNNSDQDICDLKIFDAKDANGNAAKIDSVYVNDKKVYGAPPSAASVHVYFPCVPGKGTFKVSVKFHGGIQVVTYTVIPTNKDSANIVTNLKSFNINDRPANSLTNAGGISVVSGAGSESNKVSFAAINLLPQAIHGFIVKAYDNGQTIKLSNIKVNGNVWPIMSSISNLGKTVRVDKGANSSIITDVTFSFAVQSFYNTATIDSLIILPTDSLGRKTSGLTFNGGSEMFLMPNENSAFGIKGRSGSLVAINESCSPIQQLVFSSPDTGVKVTSVVTPYPSTYNSTQQKLTFTNPVPAGVDIDLTVVLSGLIPYSPTDSFPYTTIEFFAPGSQPFDGWYDAYKSSCDGSTDGKIDLVFADSLVPMTYLWSNGSTDQDLINIPPGDYTVTVTSPSGCMQKKAALTSEEPYKIGVIYTDPICGGNNGGSAIAIPDGLIQNLLWSNGSTTPIIQNLQIGAYTCTVSSISGCSATKSITINYAIPVTATGTTVKLNCFGDNSGAINLNATGGNTNYLYKWNDGKTTEDRSGLKAATFTVTVTDGFGCSSTASFKVMQPAQLNINVTGTDVSCGGGSNGTAIAAATGGTKPYAFMWSNGMTTSTATGLQAGFYGVMLNDAHGCAGTGNVNINQPPPININLQFMPGNMANANVFGGVPPYTYFWNTVPPQTTQTATGLIPSQVYMLNVTDMNGCNQMQMFSYPMTKIGASQNQNNLSVDVFPNPTNGLIMVDVLNSNAGNYSIELFDASGRKVISSINQFITGEKTQLDLSSFEDGIYSLKITSDNKVQVIKVVLQKNR